MLPRLEDYFGLPYPFGKLDQIGVPDFEAGAMENAGAVTFREVALLADPATAPLAVQKRVAEVITHELAHQWFGNLVTMAWWDDLWLNEAFATWMAYKIVDDWRPEWRIWMDFEAGKGAALALDALVSAHPIRAEVNNAEEAGESFDAITYEKGGAVLRMIEGFLGADRFRDGHPPLHAAPSRGERDRRRSVGRAGRGVGAADPRAGERLDPADRVPAGRRRARAPTARRAVRAEAAALLRRSGAATRRPGAARRGGWCRWCCGSGTPSGMKEQPVLLREAAARVTLDGARARSRGASATPTRAGSTGPTTTTRRWRGCCRRSASCARPSGWSLISDQWALVRADQAPIERFLDLVVSLRGEEDHVVLDEVVGRLALIEHRFLADEDRAALRRAASTGLLRRARRGARLVSRRRTRG